MNLLKIIEISKEVNEKLTFLKAMDIWTSNSPTKRIPRIEQAVKSGEIQKNTSRFPKEVFFFKKKKN